LYINGGAVSNKKVVVKQPETKQFNQSPKGISVNATLGNFIYI